MRNHRLSCKPITSAFLTLPLFFAVEYAYAQEHYKKAEQQPAEHDANAVKRILLRMAKPLHQRTPGADIKQVKGKKIAPHRPQKDCGPHHKVGEGAEGSQSHRQRKDGERAVDQNGDQDMQRVAAAIQRRFLQNIRAGPVWRAGRPANHRSCGSWNPSLTIYLAFDYNPRHARAQAHTKRGACNFCGHL